MKMMNNIIYNVFVSLLRLSRVSFWFIFKFYQVRYGLIVISADFFAWVINPCNKVNCKKLASYSFFVCCTNFWYGRQKGERYRKLKKIKQYWSALDIRFF